VGAPKYLVSVDPGAANVAWAVFEDGILQASGFTAVQETSDAARPFLVTDLFFQDLMKAFPACTAIGSGCQLVIERPQVYTGAGKSKGDPNDLISVALVVGAVLAAALGTYGWGTKTVLPATWKGQTPKNICKKRLQKELAPQEAERVRWGSHDIVDAVGIGCFKLGRYR
jgi:hypothetical protein